MFDFEEQAIHDMPVPMLWYRAQHNPPSRVRPGFPIWNRAVIQYEGAYAGEGCVRLPTRGGSVSLRLEYGVIPVLPGATYTVRAMARADGLQHARPSIRVYMIDGNAQILPQTERRSFLSLDDERWHPIEVLLDRAPPEAAFLQIDLELLQPEGNDERASIDAFSQDLDGSAWFDDLAILLRPRISLESASAGISRNGVAPEFIFSARDLAGDELEAIISIHDLDNRVIDSTRFAVDPSGRPHRWTPTLERLGWYRAVASVYARGDLIGRTTHDLAYLAESGSSKANVGMLLAEFDPAQSDHLVALAGGLTLGEVILPAWRDGTIQEEIDEHVESLASLVDRLRAKRVGVVLSLDRVPRAISESELLDPHRVVEFLSSDSEAMRAILDPVLQRLGQGVTRWMIGSIDRFSQARASLGPVVTSLARLVPGPLVMSIIPAQDILIAGDDIQPNRSIEVLRIPATMSDQAIADLADSLPSEPSTGEVWILIDPLDPTVFGVRATMRTLARQMASIHQHFGDRASGIILDQSTQGPPGPSPALATLAAASERFAGMRVVGELPVATGVRCLILASDSPDQPGSLVVWHDGSSSTTPVLEAMLAQGDVRVVDLFGNQRAVSLSAPDPRGVRTHRIEITQMPVFIEGIDTALVRFQGEFAITPDTLPTDNTHHDHKLIFTNTWPGPIDGKFILLEPGSVREDGTRDRTWDISPRAGRLDILPGASMEVPIRIAMSPYQPTGQIEAIVDVDLQAGRDYGIVRLVRPMRVSIDDLVMRVSYQILDERLIVDVSVANRSAQSRDLEIIAFAGADAVRRRSTVSDLESGGSAKRRLSFEQARVGERIFISVLDSKSGSRLNTMIELRPALASADEP